MMKENMGRSLIIWQNNEQERVHSIDSKQEDKYNGIDELIFESEP